MAAWRLSQLVEHIRRGVPSSELDTQPAAAAATVVDLDSLVVTDALAPLSAEQIDHFLLNGYVALPGVIPSDYNADLVASVDELVEARADKGRGKAGLVASYGSLGGLCSWPGIVDKVQQLMSVYGNGETQCGMHHIHANRQEAGTGSSNWHQVQAAPHDISLKKLRRLLLIQDYHSAPDVMDRAQLMIHVFFYFSGLDGRVGGGGPRGL